MKNIFIILLLNTLLLGCSGLSIPLNSDEAPELIDDLVRDKKWAGAFLFIQGSYMYTGDIDRAEEYFRAHPELMKIGATKVYNEGCLLQSLSSYNKRKIALDMLSKRGLEQSDQLIQIITNCAAIELAEEARKQRDIELKRIEEELIEKEIAERKHVASEKKAEMKRLAAKQKLENYTKQYEALEKSVSAYQRFVRFWADFDPKGYVYEVNLILSKIREEERAQQQEILKKIIVQFRNNLSSGDDSHCGLVIDVKQKVVQVQAIIGISWLKKEDIYPVGVAQCDFHNGIYQPPTDLPI